MSLEEIMAQHTVTVLRGAAEVGRTGALDRSWPADGTLECRVVPYSPSAASRMAQQGFAASHQVYTLTHPGVDERDILRWVDGSGISHDLEVSGPPQDPHGLGKFFVTPAKEQLPNN
jgi:hypothetical protein